MGLGRVEGSVGLGGCWGSGSPEGDEGSSVGLGWQLGGLEDDGGSLSDWRGDGGGQWDWRTGVVAVGVQEATRMSVGLLRGRQVRGCRGGWRGL